MCPLSPLRSLRERQSRKNLAYQAYTTSQCYPMTTTQLLPPRFFDTHDRRCNLLQSRLQDRSERIGALEEQGFGKS